MIQRPVENRDEFTVDTYCIFTLRVMQAGFIFQITLIFRCLSYIVINGLALYYYTILSDAEIEKDTAYALYLAQVWADLIIPFNLTYTVLIAYIFSEWIAMWYLMYV